MTIWSAGARRPAVDAQLSSDGEGKSLFNTPPTFAIYMVKLVTDWLLRDIGGLDKMAEVNKEKSQLLYNAIDQSNGFYQPHAETDSRSTMNVTFRVPDPALEEKFVAGAKSRGRSS